jgi:hypothetical protein
VESIITEDESDYDDIDEEEDDLNGFIVPDDEDEE